MSFTEEKLEKVVLELFNDEQITHFDGRFIHKEMSDEINGAWSRFLGSLFFN
jgi:hypothetical protein